MKKALFALLALLLAASARAEIIDIDNAELARLTAAGVPIIDIRTAPEWRDTGIVPGSRLLTFFDERGQYDAAAWLAQAKLIAKPEQPIIVICRTGNRTQAVSRFLSQQGGYRTVYNVRAGIVAWIKDGRPIASASACTPPKVC